MIDLSNDPCVHMRFPDVYVVVSINVAVDRLKVLNFFLRLNIASACRKYTDRERWVGLYV